MVFVSMREMLSEVQRKGYVMGYFESWSPESTRAVISAAEEEQSR
jgi:fructose/tagatose bisphosphate aldolase